MKKVLNYLLKLVEGALIGLAILIPGVSGGSMLMVFNVYENALRITSHDGKERKAALLFLLPYLIGLVLGVLLLASVIKFCLATFPLQTILAFTGLILGSLPMLIGKVKGKKPDFVSILLFVLMIALLVALPLLSGKAADAGALGFASGDGIGLIALRILWGVVLGFIAAGTMVVPGVSGSMVMLVLGYYGALITAVSNFKDALFSLNFSAMLPTLTVLIPFGIGCVIGIIVVTKAIRRLLDRHPTPTYYAILGLMVASPFAIFMKTDLSGITFDALTLLTSAVLLVVGFCVAFFLNRKES